MTVGDVRWVELPARGGHAQAGRRPAIIVQPLALTFNGRQFSTQRAQRHREHRAFVQLSVFSVPLRSLCYILLVLPYTKEEGKSEAELPPDFCLFPFAFCLL